MVSRQVPGTLACKVGDRETLLQANEPRGDKGQRGGWSNSSKPKPEPKEPALPSPRPALHPAVLNGKAAMVNLNACRH